MPPTRPPYQAQYSPQILNTGNTEPSRRYPLPGYSALHSSGNPRLSSPQQGQNIYPLVPTQPNSIGTQEGRSNQIIDPRLGSRPDYIIIGLFALRLARRLIQKLDVYPSRDKDIEWLEEFTALYPHNCALAKLKGSRIDTYVTSYRGIVSRFIKQPRYPVVLMSMDPDRQITERALTDQECMDVIDFADAASEWGSTIKIPAHEAKRMEELANTRRRLAE